MSAVLNPTMEDGWLALAAVLLFLILNGALNLAEGAVSGLKKSRVRALAEEKDRRAPVLQEILDASDRYHATCHVGSQLLRAVIFCLTALAAAALFGGWLNGANGLALGAVVALSVLVSAVVNLAVFELPLRGLGRKHADAWAFRLRRFLTICRALFSPFVFLAERVGGFLAARLQTEPLFTAPTLTEEDLMELVENSDSASGLVEDEREMIHSIIEFGDTVAREVMTPRTDVYAVEANATLQEVAALIRDSGHTRIPVYHDTIDNIVGIVHAKDVLAALAEGNGATLQDLIRPAYFIPESKSLQQLLSEFRSGKTQMAIVQDEFGGTAGVVTIEDLVEEIVGEIVDEYDEEEPEIVQLSDGRWSVNGKMNLDDLGNELEVPFHSEEYDTLGGFVFGLFGRQPTQGESIVHENYRLTVQETDGRRVRRVLIERLADTQGEEIATGVS